MASDNQNESIASTFKEVFQNILERKKKELLTFDVNNLFDGKLKAMKWAIGSLNAEVLQYIKKHCDKKIPIAYLKSKFLDALMDEDEKTLNFIKENFCLDSFLDVDTEMHMDICDTIEKIIENSSSDEAEQKINFVFDQYTLLCTQFHVPIQYWVLSPTAQGSLLLLKGIIQKYGKYFSPINFSGLAKNAITKKNTENVLYLYMFDRNKLIKDFESQLVAAVRTDDIRIVQTILSFLDKDYTTTIKLDHLLCEACKNNDGIEMFKYLLSLKTPGVKRTFKMKKYIIQTCIWSKTPKLLKFLFSLKEYEPYQHCVQEIIHAVNNMELFECIVDARKDGLDLEKLIAEPTTLDLAHYSWYNRNMRVDILNRLLQLQKEKDLKLPSDFVDVNLILENGEFMKSLISLLDEGFTITTNMEIFLRDPYFMNLKLYSETLKKKLYPIDFKKLSEDEDLSDFQREYFLSLVD